MKMKNKKLNKYLKTETKKEKMNTRSIAIMEKQKLFLNKYRINLSHFVRDAIDSLIQKENGENENEK